MHLYRQLFLAGIALGTDLLQLVTQRLLRLLFSVQADGHFLVGRLGRLDQLLLCLARTGVGLLQLVAEPVAICLRVFQLRTAFTQLDFQLVTQLRCHLQLLLQRLQFRSQGRTGIAGTVLELLLQAMHFDFMIMPRTFQVAPCLVQRFCQAYMFALHVVAFILCPRHCLAHTGYIRAMPLFNML